MQTQPASRGGRREGAGPKPKPIEEKFVRQTVYLDPSHVDLIKWHQEQTHISFSHALRAMLDTAYHDVL